MTNSPPQDLTYMCRTCGGCRHWQSQLQKSPNGYIESVCTQPPDERDHRLMRGGETCSHWEALV
jgi:hypothetical protein